MRWNCPHCGTGLSIEEKMLGDGWNFSRCYQCGGFGLIRKAEINLVKVDRVPQGEQILLPELSGEPLMGQNAIQNLQQIRSEMQVARNQKFETEKALRKMAPPPLKKKTQPNPELTPPLVIPSHAQGSLKADAMISEMGSGSISKSKSTLSPLVIAGILSLAAGGFFFAEGKRLVNQFRLNSEAVDSTTSTASSPQRSPAHAPQADSGDSTPAPVPALVSVREPVAKAEAPAVLKVKPRSTNILLRDGPGTEFNSLGHADAAAEYSVIESKESWIHLQLPAGKTAWVRSDLVSTL